MMIVRHQPEKQGPPDAFSEGRTPTFEESAKQSLANSQLRRNLGKATQTIRRKRGVAVAELPDWEELRESGRALKARTLRHLDDYLVQLEESVTRAGGRFTGRATPRRPTGSSPASRRATTPKRS